MPESADDEKPEDKIRLSPSQERVLTWLIVSIFAFALLTLGAAWVVIIALGIEEVRKEVMTQHFVAIVCLPASGLGAFMLVIIFRQTEGPIQFEAFSMKFKGAAGPVILWILCFFSMASAFKLVW